MGHVFNEGDEKADLLRYAEIVQIQRNRRSAHE
jgi:hypothetical protein